MTEETDYATRWVELYNDGSERFAVELYSENVKWTEMPNGFFPEGRGGDRAAVVAAVHRRNEAWRDAAVELVRSLVAGDVVVIEYHWTAAIKRAPWVGGKVMHADVAAIHVLNADGRAAEVTEYVSSSPTNVGLA